jgi:hypothetical protein
LLGEEVAVHDRLNRNHEGDKAQGEDQWPRVARRALSQVVPTPEGGVFVASVLKRVAKVGKMITPSLGARMEVGARSFGLRLDLCPRIHRARQALRIDLHMLVIAVHSPATMLVHPLHNLDLDGVVPINRRKRQVFRPALCAFFSRVDLTDQTIGIEIWKN